MLSHFFQGPKNRRARQNNLNSDGTEYHGTRAYDNPNDGLMWRSHTHTERVHIPTEVDYIAELYAKVSSNPGAFDDFTGAWLDYLIDAQVQAWIAKADRVRKEKQKHTEQVLWAEGHTALADAETRLSELQVKIDQQDENFRRHRDALRGKPDSTKAWDSEIKTHQRIDLAIPQLASEHPALAAAPVLPGNWQTTGNRKALHPVPPKEEEEPNTGTPAAKDYRPKEAGAIEEAS
jgi:hypothetical protein